MPSQTTRRAWVWGAVTATAAVGCGSGVPSTEAVPTSSPKRQGDPSPTAPERGDASTFEPKVGPAPEPAALDLQVSIQFMRGERGRDSYERLVRCTVVDRAVKYYGPYGKCTRGQCPHKEVTFDLSEAERNSLVQLLEEQDLFRTFTDRSGTDDLGSFRDITLTTRLKQRAGAVSVAGMWSNMEDASTQLDADARNAIRNVDALVRLLGKFTAPHLPGLH